jgi:hypothetical protein
MENDSSVALEPAELIARNSSGFYPYKTGVVEISPIVLESDAVVFSLSFVDGNENKLVFLTDKGVVTWELAGAKMSGKREMVTLPLTEPSVYDEPRANRSATSRTQSRASSLSMRVGMRVRTRRWFDGIWRKVRRYSHK